MVEQQDLATARRIVEGAPFIRDLGLALTGAGEGWCETELVLAGRHLQQDGYVHAGVQATMADHTAGAAAATRAGPGRRVLTAEFKINLLRAACGERLRCRGSVRTHPVASKATSQRACRPAWQGAASAV